MNNGTTGGPSPVVPSQFTPKNGATTTTQTPAPAVETKTAPPPAAVQTPSEVESLKAKLAEAEKREVNEKRTRIGEKRQWEREKQSFGEKLKAADEYSRLKREANVNPIAAAKALWGDKWHEHLNTVAANGGAPTAESVQMEIEAAERRAEEKARAYAEEQQKTAREAQAKAVEQRLRVHTAQAVEFAKSTANDYPIFEQFKSPERVAGAIVARQRDVFEGTTKRDDEGNVISQGRAITFKEAADLIEQDLIAIYRSASKHEKYTKADLTSEKASGTLSSVAAVKSSESQQSPSSQSLSQGRRSLTNDLTGSTQPDAPQNLTDEERMRRALAKYEEARASKGKA